MLVPSPEYDLDVDPLWALETEIGKNEYVHVEGLPEITGGAIGYITYDR